MTAPSCPYCGRLSKLVDSEIIYGTSYGLVYDCRPCDAYVGVHKGTTKPLGRLADKELREWKKRAHAAFDPFWQGPLESEKEEKGRLDSGAKRRHRGYAYWCLSTHMNIPKEQCHIGMFSVEQCREVVRICASWAEKQRAQ